MIEGQKWQASDSTLTPLPTPEMLLYAVRHGADQNEVALTRISMILSKPRFRCNGERVRRWE